MKSLFTLAALLLLSGCGTLSGLVGADANAAMDRAAKRFADSYCVQPLAVRETDSRPRVNKAISPHQARMDCYGDPANPIKEVTP